MELKREPAHAPPSDQLALVKSFAKRQERHSVRTQNPISNPKSFKLIFPGEGGGDILQGYVTAHNSRMVAASGSEVQRRLLQSILGSISGHKHCSHGGFLTKPLEAYHCPVYEF